MGWLIINMFSRMLIMTHPKIIYFSWIFHYKPSSYWGTPIYGNHHDSPIFKPCKAFRRTRGVTELIQNIIHRILITSVLYYNGLTMAYGRYNELVFMGINGLSTNVHITGGPHPVACFGWFRSPSLRLKSP